ncbi:MAG TPA: glycoside hydrolase family 16 protein [Polyangiaceae bacterium]|nr:glycoside hydrolase family 16 protein [Polyangiaceae bacterium]
MLSHRFAWFLLLTAASVLGGACGDSSAPEGAGGGGSGERTGGASDSGVTDDTNGSGGSGMTTRDAPGGAAGTTTGGGGPIVSVDARADDTGRGLDGNATRDSSSGGSTGQDSGPRADGGGAVDVGSSGDGSRPGWSLIWSDEFNAASGTGADTTKWNLVNKGDGFGNGELEYYTNRTANAYHDGNGFLVIKAIKETYMNREYTSARLESNGKFDHLYGRYEARLQLPRGQGIWPAFWMLGNNIGSAGWPTCGEVDIMENIGKEPSIVHGSLHGPGYSGGNPLGQAYTLPNGGKYADGFHVFAIEWELNVMRFYIDDILYGTKTPADAPSGARWVYDHPFYLLLNVAVGGTWPGAPDATTVFPQMMLADYVRVYSR